MPLPKDVIVSDRVNEPGGYKLTLGFTCSHDFDEENNPGGESGPMFFARVQHGGGQAAADFWATQIDTINAFLQSSYGFSIPAASAAAMEATRANTPCG